MGSGISSYDQDMIIWNGGWVYLMGYVNPWFWYWLLCVRFWLIMKIDDDDEDDVFGIILAMEGGK